ncbi:MAG: hypothetical protein ABIH88_00310 [Patescibacteria group bacterium]|nr:hypothetical protein [Patescibacteria group bacterium]
MNETNLTQRQNFILNVIDKSNGVLRGEIQKELDREVSMRASSKKH